MPPKGRNGQGQAGQNRIQIPENVSEFYANSLQDGMTPWDFMLFFGSLELPTSVPGGVNQEIRGSTRVDAVIRMSPQHTKAVARALNSSIKRWEELFGEIQIPDTGVSQ